MRAILVAMLAVLGLVAAAHADFDHGTHATATRDAVPCAQCHPVTKSGALGRAGHAACFGACHGATPALPPAGKPLVIAPDRAKVCATCHTQAALDHGRDRKAFAAPSPRGVARGGEVGGNDFALAVGHLRHVAVPCAQCHPSLAPTASPTIPHRRCAGCHVGGAGKGPPLALCTGCHLPAGAPPTALTEAALVVGGAYSHAKHAARGGAAARCTTCHAAATTTDARELPRPRATDCASAGCHDGRPVFSVTAACTRCHQTAPTTKFEVARPDRPFAHASHLALVELVVCSTCHPVTPSGEVAVADHAACATCHADDFGARRPKICGACHNATEPWRPLVPDRFPPARSEFGASLDHDQHPAPCASCHTLTTATTQLRPERGHRACAGAACHATSGGSPPAFTSCVGCHELGLADRREAARTTARWSVRSRFVHAPHEKARDGSAIACTRCHVELGGRELMSIATPAKATCAPCHDGQGAFKLTGTGCARCHGGPR